MPQGKTISPEVLWIVVRLCATMSDREVSMYTDLSERKVKDIRLRFRREGIGQRIEHPTLHRKGLLDEDLQV
jgi:transposase